MIQPYDVGLRPGPEDTRTRVSATTTFSPRFSNACRTERRSESPRLKHGTYIEARSARIGVATVNRADQGRGGFPDPDPSPGADE
jgi:hypothetical protein